MSRPIRISADEVDVIDFNDESQPLLERVLNYGLSGLTVVPLEIQNGQRVLSDDQADATLRLAQIHADMFTAQCDIAFDIANRLPIVSSPGVELYRQRAHQFVMTAVNEILRDMWEQMRMPEAAYMQTTTILQNIIEPFASHGMLQPHWIQYGEVRQTLMEIPVPRGLYVRTLGQQLVGVDRAEASPL